jgi:hypothetical protein
MSLHTDVWGGDRVSNSSYALL